MRNLSGGARTTIGLIAAIVLTVAGFGIDQSDFLSRSNLLGIAEQTAVISIVALGMTIVIVNRGIDLSVGSSLALAGVVAGKAMTASHGSAAATIATAIAVGVAVGAFNGVLVAVLRINAFMATLGTYALASGAATSISGGSSTSVTNGATVWLGSADLGGVPVSAILTVLLVVVIAWAMSRTVLGRRFYAHGSNRTAAISTGISVRTVEFLAYVAIGLLVGLSSVVTIGRVHSVQPLAGQGLEFSAITAAVIGGTRLSGGRGNVVNTFLGSVFVGVISAGLSFVGLDQSLIYVLRGALIVVAVLVSQREILQVIYDRYRSTVDVVRSGGRHTESGPDGSHELAVSDITKRFPGVVALSSVSFAIRSGEIVALMGENGAGKSTLVKILAGNQRPTEGRIILDGQPVQFGSAQESQRAGIAVIHQHFTLVPDLTVAENLCLGREPRRWPLGPIDRPAIRSQAEQLLAELEIPVPVDIPVSRLGVGHRQMVEIARAVREEAWLVIMDEPTSALSDRERDLLYEFIERLKRRGTAVLYISHKLDEVYHLAGRAVVLRDGAVVDTADLSRTKPAELVALMVGRTVDSLFPHEDADPGDERLVVTEAGDGGLLRDASLAVRAGEVVGLVGLMGSGRTELIRAVMGLSRLQHGQIRLDGTDIAGLSVRALTDRGVAYIPEDRMADGIFPDLTVSDNTSLLWIGKNSPTGLIRRPAERTLVADLVNQLGVRPADPRREIRLLSGGNQQKVVLAKWLALSPTLVLLDDPTRGVDVGAKAEIHRLIAELKRSGVAVLLTSSEMPEVLGVADRVVVLRGGVTVAEYPRGIPEEQIMQDVFGNMSAGVAQ